MNIPMPLRNTTAEVVARAGGKCIRLACAAHYPSVALGEVGKVVSGGTPSTQCLDYWGGDVVWVTPKDLGRPRNIEIDSAERAITQLGVSSSSARLLPVGTVLLSSRAPIGHLGIAAKPLTTNQGFKNIICSERLYHRYLFHILRSSIEELAAKGRGNTFAEIPGNIVKQFRIPLPPMNVQRSISGFLDALYLRLAGHHVELPMLSSPLAEQHRVVARIEEFAAQVHEARTLREQAAKEADVLWLVSLRAAMLGGESKEVELAEACDALIDNLHSNPSYSESGVSCVRSPDVGWGRLFLDKALRTDEDEYRRRTVRGEPQVDDIVFVREGGGTGKCALVLPGQRFSLGQRVMMLRPKRQVVDPRFFLYQLLSPLVQEDQIAALTKGSASPHLNIGALRRFRFRLPSLAEQRRIVAKLDALQAEVDELKRLQAETNTQLQAFLPTILDRAFKGEL